MLKSLNILIKPASGLCNMRCKYCFYEDSIKDLSQKKMELMTPETAEKLIMQAFAEPRQSVSFAFQGGEPSLCGLDYFQNFLDTVELYRNPECKISYAIQSNCLLFDDQWAAFLAKNRFLVGVSLDGTADLHDSMRIDNEGQGTYKRVTDTISLLKRYGVDYNILCVVTGHTARRGQKIYRHLKDLGCKHLQFIPCLDPLKETRGSQLYSLTPERYAQFLCDVFDVWRRDLEKGTYISIRQFDDYIHLLCGNPPSNCANSGMCGLHFVIEADGSVYPCDFYVLNSWLLGNTRDQSFEELAASPVARAFLDESRQIPASCKNCGYYSICRGGCKRDKFISDGQVHNYYCSAFQQFFHYALPRMKEIARQEMLLNYGQQPSNRIN